MEDCRKRQSHRGRIDEKKQSRRFRRKLVDTGAYKKHQRKRRQHEHPHQRALQQLRTGEPIGQHRDETSQTNADGHVVIYPKHVDAQARINRGRRIGGGVGDGCIAIVIRHGSYPFSSAGHSFVRGTVGCETQRKIGRRGPLC